MNIRKSLCILACGILSWTTLHAQMASHAQATLDEYARRYLGQPYVEKALEERPEHLVIDTARVDCTTLVEYCLARRLSDAGKAESAAHQKAESTALSNAGSADSSLPSAAAGSFEDWVGRVRYREYEPGRTVRYADRLHYVTEWVSHAEALGILEDISESLGGVRSRRTFSFMSRHPSSYPALADAGRDPVAAEDLRIIRNEVEPRLSGQPIVYIPREKVAAIQDRIRPGDIILFTTSVEGLDVSHMAIAFKRRDGKMGFIHASSAAGKVVEDSKTIAEYVRSRPSITGIKVARPK